MIWAWMALAACSNGSGEPSLAMDVIYLEPDGDDVVGLQTWELFDETFPDDGSYVCSIVFQLTGTPSTSASCDACDQLWDIEPTWSDSDCVPRWSDAPDFAQLAAAGIGALGPALLDDDPHDGASLGGYVDAGDGEVIPHGWAYPEALDAGQAAQSSTWGADEGWVLWPAWVWEL